MLARTYIPDFDTLDVSETKAWREWCNHRTGGSGCLECAGSELSDPCLVGLLLLIDLEKEFLELKRLAK